MYLFPVCTEDLCAEWSSLPDTEWVMTESNFVMTGSEHR